MVRIPRARVAPMARLGLGVATVTALACGGSSPEARLAAERDEALPAGDFAPFDFLADLAPRPPATAPVLAANDLFGAAPATLGSALAGVTLGMPRDQLRPATLAAIAAFERSQHASVRLFFESSRLDAVHLHLFDQPDLTLPLIERWGHADATEPLMWLDVDRRVRLVLEHDPDAGTALLWERFSTVDDLIAPLNPHKFGFEPVALLGAPLATAQRALGPALEASPTRLGYYEFRRPPLALGVAPVRIALGVEHGMVTEIRIVADTAEPSGVLHALVEKSTRAKDPVIEAAELHFGKRSVHIDLIDDQLELVITPR